MKGVAYAMTDAVSPDHSLLLCHFQSNHGVLLLLTSPVGGWADA